MLHLNVSHYKFLWIFHDKIQSYMHNFTLFSREKEWNLKCFHFFREMKSEIFFPFNLFEKWKVKWFFVSLFSRSESEIEIPRDRDREVKFQKKSREFSRNETLAGYWYMCIHMYSTSNAHSCLHADDCWNFEYQHGHSSRSARLACTEVSGMYLRLFCYFHSAPLTSEQTLSKLTNERCLANIYRYCWHCCLNNVLMLPLHELFCIASHCIYIDTYCIVNVFKIGDGNDDDEGTAE